MKPPRYQIQRKLHKPGATWRTMAESDFLEVARSHYRHFAALTSFRGTVRLIDHVEGETIEWTTRMVIEGGAAIAAKEE